MCFLERFGFSGRFLLVEDTFYGLRFRMVDTENAQKEMYRGWRLYRSRQIVVGVAPVPLQILLLHQHFDALFDRWHRRLEPTKNNC